MRGWGNNDNAVHVIEHGKKMFDKYLCSEMNSELTYYF